MTKVFEMIEKEQVRQELNVELIASENFVSDDILRAMGSCLTNKYAEGYPGARYYGGCKYVDEIENYCRDMWKKVFNTDYHVNVQPHSGSQANFAAYEAVLKPGDTVLSLSLDDGGHLTHGSPVNFSGKKYNFIHYGLFSDGMINIYDIYRLVVEYRPKLVVFGASSYPRKIDFEKLTDAINLACTHIRDYAEDPTGLYYQRPYIMVDMSHIAGLVAAGDHPSPFGIADIITTTTHKTLRGPRGGLIFCKPELAKKVDSAIFPGSQGGPLMHTIAAKAIAAEEACADEFKNYIHQVVKNTEAMSDEFKRLGYDVVTDGTDNHMLVLDFTKTHPNLTGLMVQDELDKRRITLNKNCVPKETRSPKQTSGVRIGTAAMTTKGWKEKEFINMAREIDEIIGSISYDQT